MITLFLAIVVIVLGFGFFYVLLATTYSGFEAGLTPPVQLPKGRSSNVPPSAIRRYREGSDCYYLSSEEATELGASLEFREYLRNHPTIGMNLRYGCPEYWMGRKVVVVDPALHHLTVGRA